MADKVTWLNVQIADDKVDAAKQTRDWASMQVIYAKMALVRAQEAEKLAEKRVDEMVLEAYKMRERYEDQ